MRGRLKVKTYCPVCQRLFFPWHRKRTGRPACSVKCARTLTGRAQLGKPLTAASLGRKNQAARRLEALCQGEFGTFTDRERLIFVRAFRAGYDRGYPQSWRVVTTVEDGR